MAACAVSVALLPALAGSPAAHAATPSGIHPGVAVTFGGITCKAGAIMRQGARLYVAIPASCAGIQPGVLQDGCAAAETPIGIPVHIAGARHHGTLVYNSFTEMQLHGVTDKTMCDYNDLALVRINRRDASRVSGAIPGSKAPQQVTAARPTSGTAMTVNRAPATAGATHHHGWEHDFTTLAALGPADVGAPVVFANQLVGMLTVLPSGLVAKSPAETYSLAKAMWQMHKVAGFRHVVLLRAGQRG